MLHYFKLLGPLFGTRDATNAKVLDFALVEVFNRGVATCFRHQYLVSMLYSSARRQVDLVKEIESELPSRDMEKVGNSGTVKCLL